MDMWNKKIMMMHPLTRSYKRWKKQRARVGGKRREKKTEGMRDKE